MNLLISIIAAATLSATPDSEWDESIRYVSEMTGEHQAVIETIIVRESGKRTGSVRYCTKWEPVTEGTNTGKIKCVAEASCYSTEMGCYKNKAVWNNRLDVGAYGIRDVPYRVNKVRTVGSSWIRTFDEKPECSLNLACATKLLVKMILRMQAYTPKKCNARGVPDELASFLTYYSAGGGPKDKKGCLARKKRLQQSGLIPKRRRRGN